MRLCDPTLQPFYGVYGTVLTIRSCGGGRVEYVAVQMDDLPPNEGPALFYPHQVAVVTEEP
nr:MAG: hypothetical protein DIU80_04545 [Chloroflexota bacterium]